MCAIHVLTILSIRARDMFKGGGISVEESEASIDDVLKFLVDMRHLNPVNIFICSEPSELSFCESSCFSFCVFECLIESAVSGESGGGLFIAECFYGKFIEREMCIEE